MTLPYYDTIQHWDAMTLDTDTKLKFFLNKYLGPTQVKCQLLFSSIFLCNEFPTFFGNAGI